MHEVITLPLALILIISAIVKALYDANQQEIKNNSLYLTFLEHSQELSKRKKQQVKQLIRSQKPQQN